MQAENGMGVGRKILASVTAATLTASMMAFAPLGTSKAYAAADVTGYVTCDAYRAAEPAPEILGISGISTNNAWAEVGELDWANPVYYIMGTDLNSNANPYMTNAVANYQAGNSDAQPSLVYTQRQGGPTAAKYAYGENENCDAGWNMLPDIIFGTGQGTSVDYSDAAYAPAAGAANNNPDYDPEGVPYVTTNVYTMIDSMYDLAAAADEVVAESNGAKKLRYGNATDIAKQYEKYVRGTQGYVLSQLAANGAQKKTVAAVKGYDEATQTYTLILTGVAEGTATANRYLEACQNVAVNLADTKTAAEDGTVTVTRDELAQVDLILLGSQTGSEVVTSNEDILATFTEDMVKKSYWVASDNTSAGSCYGVIMNSVENAQNTGRILGCLYPEYVDQDQWVCYYYDNFYHLTTSGLSTAVDNAMDSVRNWDAAGSELTSWTTADAADYNEAAVDQKLEQGIAYIQNNASSVPSLLQLTDEYTGETPAPATTFSDVSASDWFYGPVEFAVAEDLMHGYSGTDKFGPLNSLTRAETAAIMFNYAAANGENPSAASDRNTTGLADLDATDWYTEVCNWAVAEGVMGNDPAGFRPGDTITMEELLAVISNVTGADTASADTSVLASYADASSVDEWAEDVVAWGVQEGIVGNNTVLEPTTGIYRARVAAILYNSINAGVM